MTKEFHLVSERSEILKEKDWIIHLWRHAQAGESKKSSVIKVVAKVTGGEANTSRKGNNWQKSL